MLYLLHTSHIVSHAVDESSGSTLLVMSLYSVGHGRNVTRGTDTWFEEDSNPLVTPPVVLEDERGMNGVMFCCLSDKQLIWS